MKYKKYRKLFLPKNIVDIILHVHSVHPLENTGKSSLEVAFAIVNDIISKTAVFNRDEKYPFHHIPMYSKYLEVKYGNDYKRYIEWLWLHNIIWFDNPKEGKATHYYLQTKDHYDELFNSIQLKGGNTTGCTYNSINNISILPHSLDNKEIGSIQKSGILSDYCVVQIQISKQNQSFLTRDYADEAKRIHNAPKHVRAMAQHYKKNLKINYTGAITHTTNQYQEEITRANTVDEKDRAYRRYTSRLASIHAIHEGKSNKSLRFKRNDTNGRIDTNLTNMASDLRPFIIGYEDMTYLDLKNSQPVLFNILLRPLRNEATSNQIKEMDTFYDLTTSGKWYEHLSEIFGCDRETAKEAWMVIAYSKNTTKYFTPLKKHFEQHFPFINQVIVGFKEHNHNQFAIELQKVESDLFIDKICVKLVKENIIPFTFHDAILIPTADKNRALEIMQNTLECELGSIPKISVE